MWKVPGFHYLKYQSPSNQGVIENIHFSSLWLTYSSVSATISRLSVFMRSPPVVLSFARGNCLTNTRVPSSDGAGKHMLQKLCGCVRVCVPSPVCFLLWPWEEKMYWNYCTWSKFPNVHTFHHWAYSPFYYSTDIHLWSDIIVNSLMALQNIQLKGMSETM